MKKIIFSMVGICLLFLSCEQEIIENQEGDSLMFSTSSSQALVNCEPDIEGFELSLPESVTVDIINKPGTDAYFDIDILDSDLAGTNIGAFCVDIELSLDEENDGLSYDVYSSYEDLPSGVFEHPENFDLVNWILNQPYIGQESPSGGAYTYGHVQWAIWKLTDDVICNNCSNLTIPIRTWKDDEAGNIAKGTEILEAALANGEGFIPQCGQKIGIILIPDGKQPIIIMKDVPEKEIEEECFECEGKVTELELQYNGDVEANIRVETKKDGENGGKVVFDGNVAPGETFSFVGNDKKGTLGTEIKIYVNGDVNTKIHTSCSKPIGPGLISGDFEVISGASRNGGELCPVDTPPSGGGDDCSECDGKITRLDLQYDGGSAALIEVVQKKDGIVVFSGNVNAGGTFTFSGEDKKGTLGTEIIISVNGSESQRIHTSCSVEIGAGSVFGDFTVLGGASRNGGELCPVNVPTDDGGH